MGTRETRALPQTNCIVPASLNRAGQPIEPSYPPSDKEACGRAASFGGRSRQ